MRKDKPVASLDWHEEWKRGLWYDYHEALYGKNVDCPCDMCETEEVGDCPFSYDTYNDSVSCLCDK